MNGPSISGGKESHFPDLKFPIRESTSARHVQTFGEAAEIIEYSESLLPIAAGQPDFEARRLALKSRVPFRLLD
jgi:hypothetical protein